MNLNFENPTILKSLLSNTREFHFVSQKMFKLSKIDEGNDEEFNFSEHLNTSLLSLSLNFPNLDYYNQVKNMQGTGARRCPLHRSITPHLFAPLRQERPGAPNFPLLLPLASSSLVTIKGTIA